MSIVEMFASIPSSKTEENATFTDIMENGNSCGNNTNGTAITENGTSNNKSTTGRRKFGDNGFEEQGGYMAVKKAKLDEQFNTSNRLFSLNENATDIFKGISIYINGYTSPPEPELRELFIRYGGSFHPYCTSRTSYVVATNLSAPSKRLYGSKTVTPDWIMDSIATRKLLDIRKYKLYDLLREKKQMTLTQSIDSKTKVPSTNSMFNHISTSVETSDISKTAVAIGIDKNPNKEDSIVQINDSDKDEFFECSQEIPVTGKYPRHPIRNGNGEAKISPTSVENSETEDGNIENGNHTDSEEDSNPDLQNGEMHPSIISLSPATSPNKEQMQGRIKTANDDGFIEDFFGRSRLHLISEQKKEMQVLIGNMRKNISSHSFPNLKRFEAEVESNHTNGHCMENDKSVYLMHVDLDCFFASVGMLSRPHLRGKPVVVTHSSGKVLESKSDIACASYEARKFGIKNGMWVGEAKHLCADLEVIPYDFEEYRCISKCFFEIISTVTLDVEPNSVDEMVVDVTSVLKKVPRSSPTILAEFLRKIVFEETQCPASVGIGSNRLLAKLAVKLAKPNGVYHLKDNDAPDYIASLDVRDLPGVGWSNESKLHDKFKVQTCGDLLQVPIGELKSAFGEKTAEKMQRGLDTSELKFGIDRPKSISVDVNFGIRFNKDDDVTSFVNKICKELSTRAERIQALSTHFTLKLLVRKKNAGAPLKHGGHGLVDSITRSRSLLNPTRNSQELYKTACSLIRVMGVPPTEYRGVGVTLSDLTFDCDKSSKRPVQRTLNDMPLSRAQKMLSISKNRNKVLTPQTLTTVKDSSESNVDKACIDISDDNTPPVPAVNHESNSEADSNNKQPIQRKSVISFAPDPKPSNDKKPVGVDINVLRQLPREIAEEQCNFYGLDKNILDQVETNNAQNGESGNILDGQETGNQNGELASYYDNIETIDQSFLLALPDTVRQDVLIQLQEAKGRRNLGTGVQENINDEQPCSSRQAIERSKKLEEQRKAMLQKTDENENPGNEHKEIQNGNSEISVALEDQTTPVLDFDYISGRKNVIDPQKFWDITVDYQVLHPQKAALPALNQMTEIEEVRNLIREGLESVNDPTTEDVTSLHQYFTELVKNGWLYNTEVLLKFLQRQVDKLGSTSSWTPVLVKLIDDTQNTCQSLYHGSLNLEP